jgi:hypothetical protein
LHLKKFLSAAESYKLFDSSRTNFSILLQIVTEVRGVGSGEWGVGGDEGDEEAGGE